MAGRRPKPTAIKELNGNPGRRPLNEDEPKVAKGVPEMPKGMGHVANREWRRIVPELLAVGVLSIVDGKALAQYCRAEAMGEKYYRDALKEPYAFNAKGEMKLSPAAMGWATCTKISKAFLIEFGLTPASRSKLKVEKKESELPDVELAPVPTSIEEIELPDETVVQ